MKLLRIAIAASVALSFAGTGQAGLVSYWSFDGATTGSGGVVDTASSYGGIGGNNGTFTDNAMPVSPGLIGSGAGLFHGTGFDGVNVGSGGGTVAGTGTFATTTGITVEALIEPTWTPSMNPATSPSYAEIFRKEDGNNRILLSFQSDGNYGGAQPPVAIGPALSLGLDIGGAYNELDMPLDGQDGRPTLAYLENGNPHLVVATYDSASGAKDIYIDGSLAYSYGETPGSLLLSGGNAAAYIGNLNNGNEPFSGKIDEVAFWNNALTASQVSAQWTNVQNGRNYFAAVPEPGGLLLAGCSLLGIAALTRRRYCPSGKAHR